MTVAQHAPPPRQGFTVPFGSQTLTFQLPAGLSARVAVPTPAAALPNPRAAIETALDHPLGTPPLEQFVAAANPPTVCIAFTDATRACPDHLLVPPILARLQAAGVPNEAITLLCAVGLHRPSTRAEKRAKLGDDIVNRYRIIDHNARDPRHIIHLGQTPEGIPLAVSKPAYRAGLLIATGLVEPHQYAGYSGGAKTVAIGCGGEETIAYTHGPKMLDHPGVRLGRVSGNPFQDVVRRVAGQAGLSFVLNVVQDENHRILHVAAGAPDAVHQTLVEHARRIFETRLPHSFDLAVAGVGAPKDANLYQASRALTYLQLSSTPAVRPGGVVILPAPCPEGAGQGVGEQRFLAALRDAPDIETMLNRMRSHGYPPGAQRAFVVGQVLARVGVIVVGAADPAIVRACKMMPAATMEEAFAQAIDRLGQNLKVLVVPHALQTLVRIGEPV